MLVLEFVMTSKIRVKILLKFFVNSRATACLRDMVEHCRRAAFDLSKHTDHTLYVYPAGSHTKCRITFLEEFYQMGKFTNISILFNDLRKSGLGHDYAGYSYCGGYSLKKVTWLLRRRVTPN